MLLNMVDCSFWQCSVLKAGNHLTLLKDLPGPETLSSTASVGHGVQAHSVTWGDDGAQRTQQNGLKSASHTLHL